MSQSTADKSGWPERRQSVTRHAGNNGYCTHIGNELLV